MSNLTLKNIGGSIILRVVNADRCVELPIVSFTIHQPIVNSGVEALRLARQIMAGNNKFPVAHFEGKGESTLSIFLGLGAIP